MLVEPAGSPPVAWSSSGVGLAVNAPSGFAGNVIDFRLAGTQFLSINSSGTLTTTGAISSTGGTFTFTAGGNQVARFNAAASVQTFQMSSAGGGAGAYDVIYVAEAANTPAFRNGTSAQKLEVYNTFTSLTNYERYNVDWITSANVCLVGPEKGSGGGTLRSQWTIAEGGKKTVASDVTNNTATMANLTDLSMTLLAGRRYTGEFVIECVNSVAAEGIKFDFDGGAATMTTFFAAVSAFATSGAIVAGTVISTAIATDLNYTTLTGETVLAFKVAMLVNAGGTFIMRFAENTTATGTATVRTLSFSLIEDSN